MQTILILIGAAILYAVYQYASGLWSNIEAAKKSGLPYIVARTSPIPPIFDSMSKSLHAFQ
jgi:hypothetical protein